MEVWCNKWLTPKERKLSTDIMYTIINLEYMIFLANTVFLSEGVLSHIVKITVICQRSIADTVQGRGSTNKTCLHRVQGKFTRAPLTKELKFQTQVF